MNLWSDSAPAPWSARWRPRNWWRWSSGRGAGVLRLIVDGSYTTKTLEPNDIDLIILPGPHYPRDQSPASETIWPFLQVIVAADETDLLQWATEDFGTDRRARPKGVVEVIL